MTEILWETAILLDGESKVGSTTAAQYIAEAAVTAGLVAPEDVSLVSAGFVFRAGTLHAARNNLDGLSEADVPAITAILQEPGIEDTLRHDEMIEANVSTVAGWDGVQGVCNRTFCCMVMDGYRNSGLVVADARLPVGLLETYGFLGNGSDQIDPTRIIPVHITAPANIAAARNLKREEDETDTSWAARVETEAARIEGRRRRDRERPKDKFPYTDPEPLATDLDLWEEELHEGSGISGVPDYYHFDNGANTTLEDLRNFSHQLARLAGAVSLRRHSLAEV